MSAISCVGCHGREQDMGNDSVSAGRGAGLRQHHAVAGQTGCQNCHSDADPANFIPVGEDVLPEYYANPGTNHPSIPTDSCSPSGEEDIAGLTTGLDNDGDGDYDTADSDCGAADVFRINAGLSDAWYDPDTDGQGFFITVLPDLGVMALAWFTYDTVLPPDDATSNLGDPGNRWMTASGAYTDDQAVLNIVLTSGGIFDTPGGVERTDGIAGERSEAHGRDVDDGGGVRLRAVRPADLDLREATVLQRQTALSASGSGPSRRHGNAGQGRRGRRRRARVEPG